MHSLVWVGWGQDQYSQLQVELSLCILIHSPIIASQVSSIQLFPAADQCPVTSQQLLANQADG